MLPPVEIGTISVHALRGGSLWVVALIGEHDRSTNKGFDLTGGGHRQPMRSTRVVFWVYLVSTIAVIAMYTLIGVSGR